MKIFISSERLEELTYDNVKSHTKVGLHLLSRKYILGKTTGGQFGQFSLFKVNAG